MNKRQPITLTKQSDGSITLHSTIDLKAGVKIDAEAGVIDNVSVITRGPAMGHGFEIDDTMLGQVVKFINAKKAKGVKSRLGHPSYLGGDAIETRVGKITNARLDGEQVRATFTFGKYANSTPRGDLRGYLLGLAEDDSSSIGLSIVFKPGKFEERADKRTGLTMPPLARCEDVLAVDWVDDPAANPGGLLSQPNNPAGNSPAIGASLMNPILRAYLISLGLKTDATDTEAVTYLSALTGEQKTIANALAKPAPAPTPVTPPVTPPTSLSQADIAAEVARQVALAKAAADTAEATRKSEITALAKSSPRLGDAWALQMINGGFDINAVKAEAIKKLAADYAPIGTISVGDNLNLSTIGPAMTDAIVLRAGAIKLAKPHERANEFRGLRLHDMARQHFLAHGVRDAMQLSVADMAVLLSPREFRRRYPSLAQGTSDFANILTDAQNKTLRQAYLEAPSQWAIWARRATAPDFRTIHRTALSASPNLTAINEGGGINYVTLGDGKETYALVEYNGGLKFTRRAFINDDTDALGRAPMLQGMAAKRKEDDVAFAILTANAALADGGLLFNNTAVTTTGGHANVGTTGVISVTTLGEMRKLMRKQKDPKNAAFLNLRAKFLIVPAALESVAEQYTSSGFVAAASSSINPFAQGKPSALIPIVEPRLDDSSATAYYTVADNSTIDTVEVCFLDGEPEPVLTQETDFDTEDLKYKVRHTVAAKAIDFRGMCKNAGA